MGVSEGLLPLSLILVSSLLFVGALFAAVINADWTRTVIEREMQHLLLGVVVALMMLWNMRAGLSPGLTIHFLGITTVTLMFGWELAFIAGSAALVGMVLVGHESIEAFGITAIVSCLIPALVTHWTVRLERRMASKLFFTYLFVCGFFGAALAAAAGGLTMVGLLWLWDIYDTYRVVNEYLIYLPLIMLPEAFINGMCVTGLMVYFPQTLGTLDDSRYR